MTGLTQRPLLIFYSIWLVNNISNRILECSYSFSLMQTKFYLEWIYLVPSEIFLLRNASIDHQNQSIVEKVTFLMRNPLRIGTKKKIEKKEGCRTKKSFEWDTLENGSYEFGMQQSHGKLAVAKFNLLLPMWYSVSVTQR